MINKDENTKKKSLKNASNSVYLVSGLQKLGNKNKNENDKNKNKKRIKSKYPKAESSRMDNNEKDYKTNNYLKSYRKDNSLKSSYNSLYNNEKKISRKEKDRKKQNIKK